MEKRWWATNDQTERDRLHALAEDARRLAREGTPYQYAQDKVMDELHKNEKIVDDLEKSMREGFSGFLFQFSGGDEIDRKTSFLIGMAYGEWNYKENPEWQVPEEYRPYFNNWNMTVDNNRNWRPWMYFDGMLMAGDDMGNLNLAYIGCKMALPTSVYINFATTDGKDEFWVNYGLNLAIKERKEQSGRR